MEAHSEVDEQLGGLGEASEAANRPRRSSVAGDGNGDGGGVVARPGPRGSVERKRGSRRSSGTLRRGEGTAGSASVVSCGGGSASVREGERAGGGKEGEGECEGGRGGCVVSSGHRGRREGRQAGREGGGVARWRARAPGTLPSLCRGRRRQRRRRAGPPAGWAGLLLLGQRRQAEAQVRFSCFISFSKFSDICFDLIKY